jgi:hypothetical protein
MLSSNSHLRMRFWIESIPGDNTEGITVNENPPYPVFGWLEIGYREPLTEGA